MKRAPNAFVFDDEGNVIHSAYIDGRGLRFDPRTGVIHGPAKAAPGRPSRLRQCVKLGGLMALLLAPLALPKAPPQEASAAHGDTPFRLVGYGCVSAPKGELMFAREEDEFGGPCERIEPYVTSGTLLDYDQ